MASNNEHVNGKSKERTVSANRPMVSVGMLVYNHEKYIAKALDSILMQEVNFDYEIVVAEDCSTDGTREIIREYQKKYPEIIKPIFNEVNVGSQNNANLLRTACIGKYRATLEGDDYWVDTSKLQRQVDFLENNPDYIAIGGDFSCIDDTGLPCPFPWGDIKYTYCQGDEYTIDDLRHWLLPAHASCMCFRNIFFDFSKEELDYFHSLKILGDRRTSMYLLMNGRVKHQKETWMIRRVLKASSSSTTSFTLRTNWHARNYLWMIETERCVRERFQKEFSLAPHKELRWIGSMKVFVQNPSLSNLKLMQYIYMRSDNKKRYRKIAWEKIKEGIDDSIQKRGRLKTARLFIRKLLSAMKRTFFRTRKIKRDELKLYEYSLGNQLI